MRRLFCTMGVAYGLVVVAASWPARADVLDYLWGHSGPPTLADVAKMIDHIQRSLVNQGTVVIKQPDVWSQARMTQFRQEYEDTMAAQLTKFDVRLAGRIARSDAATFSSQTALAASISGLKPDTDLRVDAGGVEKERGTAVAVLNSTGEGAFPKDVAIDKPAATNFALLQGIAPVAGTPEGKAALSAIPLGLEPTVQLDQQSDYINHLHRLRRINLGDDNADSAGYALYLMRVPISIQPGAHTKKGFGAIANLTVSHDFAPGFLKSTYRNLVINDLVDKLAPVVHEMIRSGITREYDAAKETFSKDPNAEARLMKEYKGIVSRTDGASFVLNRSGTRRNAIAPSDLVRVFQIENLLHLAVETQQAIGIFPQPNERLITGALMTELASKKRAAVLLAQSAEIRREGESFRSYVDTYVQGLKEEPVRGILTAPSVETSIKRSYNDAFSNAAAEGPASREADEETENLDQFITSMRMLKDGVVDMGVAEDDDAVIQKNREDLAKVNQVLTAAERARASLDEANKTKAEAHKQLAEVSAQGGQEPEDTLSPEELRQLKSVRLIDVRSYLRNQMEAAYDLVIGQCKEGPPVLCDVDFIEMLVEKFHCREFEGPKFEGGGGDNGQPPRRIPPNSPKEDNGFTALYEELVDRLPGNLHGRGLGALAWGIALEAGLLNRHLREDMKETKGNNDYAAPPDVDLMCFYVPNAPPEIERAFQDYVRARWPMIVFALEPVVDQQNIEDAFTRRRDLQLAVAFALASGRLSFRQAMTYTRNLQYEAQTIALNQTVAAFANGNDTFGWRITPRYQTPPEESNFQALTNTILRGGPGPNWQLSNSKIEPGMRELTAVVVMPSFVRGVRVDTWSDWFRLSDPESRKLHTARTLEIGRRINEARDSLDLACKHGNYRPEDVERLRVRLHQLETMLPIQTSFVRVPYENTLGGFALFSQGKTDLVPQLDGYDGLDYIDPEKPTDLILYGRNFSLYETSVVVGGKSLAREGARSFVLWDTGGKPYTLSSLTNPIRDKDGNLVLQILGADNKQTTVTVPDPGSYLIQSREVMRVRVPANVAKVERADGTEAVEVNVSTPTGVSNRLLIPIRPKPPAKPPAPAAPAPGLADTATIVDPVVTIRYTAKVKSDGGLVRGTRLGVLSGSRVRFLPAAAPSLADKAEVSLEFPVASPKTTVLNAFRISDVVFENGCYVLKEAQLNDLAARIEALLAGSSLDPKAESTFTTRNVTLSIPSANPTHQLRTTNQLTVNFEFVVVQAPGAASATTTVAATPAPEPEPEPEPRRDDGARKASADKIVIPPPVRHLELDELSSPPQSQDRDMEAADAPAPMAPFERLPQRVALQEAPEPPAPEAPPVTIPAPAPPSTTTPTPTPPQTPTTDNNRPTTVVVPAPGASQTIVVAPQPPSVNVSVPITNVAKPAHRGLFRRDREPATPQNPARRSLLQRAINGP